MLPQVINIHHQLDVAMDTLKRFPTVGRKNVIIITQKNPSFWTCLHLKLKSEDIQSKFEDHYNKLREVFKVVDDTDHGSKDYRELSGKAEEVKQAYASRLEGIKEYSRGMYVLFCQKKRQRSVEAAKPKDKEDLYQLPQTHNHDEAEADDAEIANKTDYTKFVLKNSGILWEDDFIEIGFEQETRQNVGQLYMFYSNKTSQPFNKFTPSVTCPGALAAQLKAQAEIVEELVPAGTEVKQLISFVCVQEFQKTPIINLKFSFTDRGGALQNFDKNFYLPLFISKFFEPNNMISEQYFIRRESLGAFFPKAQKIAHAQTPMKTASIESKLKVLGAKLVTEEDSFSDYYECAGIIHTQTQEYVTYICLEPGWTTKMYRLVIRSTKDTVVQILRDLLGNQF